MRIRSSRDYRVIADRGTRVASKDFVLLERRTEYGVAKPQKGSSARLGITASRRVGNAVVRNRVKRRVREWFRRREESREVDWVVIARRGAGTLSAAETARRLDILASSASDRARKATKCL